jgi:hypothetical protein
MKKLSLKVITTSSRISPVASFPFSRVSTLTTSVAPAAAVGGAGASSLCTDARTMPVDASMRQPSRKPSIAMAGVRRSPASGKIMSTLPFRYRRIVINKGRVRWLFEVHRARYVIGKRI